MEDTVILHDDLHLSIDHIATITGSKPGTVTALLAAARRSHAVGALTRRRSAG